MNIVILSGGSGKRLWPLSNDLRSKQFIKILKKPINAIKMGAEFSGEYESMIQRIYRQIKTKIPDSTITIATSKTQVSSIYNQLGENVDVCIEPCRKNTFPAMALMAAYLHDVKGLSEDEVIVVCPVDSYVDDTFFDCFRGMYSAAQKEEGNIVLMGIVPTYPSEKYGYIVPYTDDGEKYYFKFTEKPKVEEAERYIQQGALWNSGVFVFKLKYILESARKLIHTDQYQSLLDIYENLEETSFDCAIVEKEKALSVHSYLGNWKDLGTWNTLTEVMEGHTFGDVRINDKCSNVHVINEMNVPILVMGLKDTIVSASTEGILVTDKEQSSYIKPFVESIDNQIKYAEKKWGSYKVLDVEENSITIKVTLNSGHMMNYHSHERRDEVWTVISGNGYAIVNDVKKEIKVGDVITMSAGCKHTVIATTELQLIEVQYGKEISVADKKIYDMPELEWC